METGFPKKPASQPDNAPERFDLSELDSGFPLATMSASGVYQCLAEVTITNKKGLHARASMLFVRCVEKFDAEVMVRKDGMGVSGSSIMGLMMLTAGPGSQIVIETEGPEAEEALDALTALIEQGFNEKD